MKYSYFFDEGQVVLKDLLGGKGENLRGMTRLGLPVPPGFTITTDVCRSYLKDRAVPEAAWQEIREQLGRLERETQKEFGGQELPLLVSVRSGAQISMPGMMDTVLNLGLNDAAVEGLAASSKDSRFAFDAYRRFIQMYSDVVMQLPRRGFDALLVRVKAERGAARDVDLIAPDLRELVEGFKRLYCGATGQAFPQDPWFQLECAVKAVFESWTSRRAVTYRELNQIPHHLGTAVTVQAMVFGNLGNDSGTGVGFTRDPSTGEAKVFGEFLLNAQGEDVVAGIRTPEPLAALRGYLPEVYDQLVEMTALLERHLRDVQDFEFTVERNKLYMLQTRTAKRSAQAAVTIAVDMVEEKLISVAEAVARVEAPSIDQVLHPTLKPDHGASPLGSGLPASPGVARGAVVFSADDAVELGGEQAVILVTEETSPEDIHGLASSQGILTVRGGMTSHAAVVARGMGKPAVVGAESIRLEPDLGRMVIGNHTVRRLDTLTLDGAQGLIFAGELPLQASMPGEKLERLLGWADTLRRLQVRANADTPGDARKALAFGAEGIGLCRTEHMFFAEGRIEWVRKMILSSTPEGEAEALEHLKIAQQEDFEGILAVMDGLPVTIRLLDPPLHEFLPALEPLAVQVAVAAAEGRPAAAEEALLRRVRALHEINPMMGLRGIRLGLLRPGLIRMQVQAVALAAAKLERSGRDPRPEIMIPLVGSVGEFIAAREIVDQELSRARQTTGAKLDIPVGTMIELPRACLVAGEIAQHANFFSFGTNDLTQMTYGFSRDDAQRELIPAYLSKGFLTADPFRTFDQEGVGQLVKLAVEGGRRANAKLKVGVCGEHGGDPASIAFFESLGLDYVSASPFRVPVARLAAARSARERASESPTAVE